MVEIKGGYYAWDQDELHETMSWILKGAELTINSKSKTAYIHDKFIHKPVSIEYANLLVMLNIVGCDSGNSETGERHYDIRNR